MDADELMDDDLFADLYGDDDSSKNAATNKHQAAKAGNGPIKAAPDSAQSVAIQSVPAPQNNTAPQQGTAMNAVSQEQPQSIVKNESIVNSVNEDNYQGWDSGNGGAGTNETGNNGTVNGYGDYSGYDANNENYGDYAGSGDGSSTLVDVGGSTAIKEDGKMFIGGLNWETTDESLKNYFSQFGEVTECTVMRDGTTGRSRGFGFLTFKDPKTVNIVMVKEHYLDGKIIDPKRAIPRDEQERTSKIFVGGVSQEASETDFREYFTQFGRVLDATLMMDKDTGRPRGFGFVTFDSESAVENALNHPSLEILGKAIEVKKAQPRGNPRDRGHEDNERPFRDRGGGRERFDRDGANQGNAFGQQNTNGSTSVNNQAGPGLYNGMSPAVMAQYWQRMQQYMAAFMQAQGRGRGLPGAGGVGAPAGMPMMNPAMMSAAMQNMGAGGMNPAAMQQFQQMQQMQMQQMQPSMGGMGGPMGAQGVQSPPQQAQVPYGHSSQPTVQGGYGGVPGPNAMGGYNQQRDDGGAYDNGMYSQQGHQQGPQHQHQHQHQQHPHQQHPHQQHPHQQHPHQQHQQHHGPHPHQQQHQHHGPHQRQQRDYQQNHQRDFNPQQQTSWEGMYDDIPSQNVNNQNPRGNSQGPMNGPNQPASGPPPNAPTGPRNARGPVGPFRGASRGNDRGRGDRGFGLGGYARGGQSGGGGQSHGFHPYARNNNSNSNSTSGNVDRY